MKKTQSQIVQQHLKEHGKISRNFCLQNYISRLGAIICDLNKEGWNIAGDWVKTEHGKDYVYTLQGYPKRQVIVDWETVEKDGVRTARPVYKVV